MNEMLVGTEVAPVYIGKQALAALGAALCDGFRQGRHPESVNASSLAALVQLGNTRPDDLLRAACTDTSLEFGVRVTSAGVLGYTGRAVALGFIAQPVKGGWVTTVSPPARDPVWVLWPWGRRLSAWNGDGLMQSFGWGVAAMLNERWTDAVRQFQAAAGRMQDLAGADLLLVRQALAANISLAVQFSHGGGG